MYIYLKFVSPRVRPGVQRIDPQHPCVCRRRQTKWGDTLAVCCDPW